VRISAVASLEKIMVIAVPSRNTLRKSRFALRAARRAACTASQSKRPAVSAMAESPIMQGEEEGVPVA